MKDLPMITSVPGYTSISGGASGAAYSAADSREDHHFWHWALVPMFAIVAFAPVLLCWYVGDDFVLLHTTDRTPGLVPFVTFYPGFYRPLSTVLTWNLGFALFGTNALPYHVLSLLLHALIAWLLGRSVASISSEARIGWFTGSVFAVYPLGTEPVAWLASQWDLWAATCILAAVWSFAAAWRTHSWPLYALSLLFATLSLLMKESALTLFLLMPFVAITIELYRSVHGTMVVQSAERRKLGVVYRVAIWTLPFFIPVLAYGAVLLASGFKGYPGTRTDYMHFVWDQVVAAGLRTIMPLNQSVFLPSVIQLTGLLMTILFLGGLVLWGSVRWPIFLLAGAWFLVFLLPVINLASNNPDNVSNRYLYLSLMGYCIAIGAILKGLLDTTVGRRIGVGLVACCFFLVAPVTWIQLQPWVQSSRQSQDVVTDLGKLLPVPQKLPIELTTHELPTAYRGSFVFFMGLDSALLTFNHQVVRWATASGDAGPSNLDTFSSKLEGKFWVGFALDGEDQLYHINDMRGITNDYGQPKSDRRWVYSDCPGDPLLDWQPNEASFECVPSTASDPTSSFARFTPTSVDGRLLLPDLDIDLADVQWVQLAVSARLPAQVEGRLGQWFWSADGQAGMSEQRSRTFALNPAGEWNIYWVNLPVSHVGKKLDALRLDPIDDRRSVDIRWISLDLIE